MAFQLNIPFYLFNVSLEMGGDFQVPLMDHEGVHLGEAGQKIAEKYRQELQEKFINEGSLVQILDEYRDGNFYKNQLQVAFPGAKDQISYPPFQLEFDYFSHKVDRGYWAILPSLGLESFGKNPEHLQKNLREVVELDFARNQRLTVVQEIIASIWYHTTELTQHPMALSILRPKEIDQGVSTLKKQWLNKVAHPLDISEVATYGRAAELEQFATLLKGKFNRNILLVGPSGVGKTALVWEIARQQKNRSSKLKIWETTASTLIKELTGEMGWRDNLSALSRELSDTSDILFIRNLMEMFKVGKSEGNTVSMAEYLRPYLSREEISLISECTDEELALIELESPSYLSYFHKIKLGEPTTELDFIILNKVRDLASHQRVNITDEAIREVISLNRRFTPYAGFPGKPIRFLESILIHQNDSFALSNQKTNVKIDRSDVIRYFCEESGMPLFIVDPETPMNLGQLEVAFNQQVFGQEQAVNTVVNLLAAVKTALTRSGKPIASLLFVGPTGVGKTELAKVLAHFMFGSRDRIIRFDMSEYSSYYDVLRLAGSDYFSEGLLSSAVRKEPFGVLLFDEIEKAHPNFYDLLLQILGEGRLTDNQGKLVNFCSSIILMTSNIGAEKFQQGRIGWQQTIDNQEVADQFMTAVQQFFRPELFNRIDLVIPFAPLDSNTVRNVVDREINLMLKREGIRFRRLDLQIDPEVKTFLAQTGYHSKYGARELQRTIREKLIIPLSSQLNQQDYDDQIIAKVNMENGLVNIQLDADPLGLDLLIEELEKSSYANYTSSLRRRTNTIKESHLYVQLTSRLQMLEQKKIEDNNLFWQDQKQVTQYTEYLNTQSNSEALEKQIVQYEMELGLACLNQGIYRPEIQEKIQEWEEQFFKLKLEILSRIYPETNTCHLAIYGHNPEAIGRFYVEILEQEKFEYEIQSVWFREKYYHDELQQKAEEKEWDAFSNHSPYLKEITRAEELNQRLKPPKTNDLCCGLELVIHGPAVFLFLEPEIGLQKWMLANNEEELYVLEANVAAQPTPDKIHRKDFFKKKTVRRVVDFVDGKQAFLKDKLDGNLKPLLAEVQEALRTHFQQAVDTSFL
ncbi:MAG: hypothetical protein DHS20C18_16440 [Saprospiraceae bacterium]|nr:MAG: hypothetical protein DHS20C18_16440 [Saprospiraceae bacterium]